MKQTIKCAYAEGTFKYLHTQWDFIFCEYFKLDPLPINADILCLYVQILNRSFRSRNSIKHYFLGIKTLHPILDLDYPQYDTA